MLFKVLAGAGALSLGSSALESAFLFLIDVVQEFVDVILVLNGVAEHVEVRGLSSPFKALLGGVVELGFVQFRGDRAQSLTSPHYVVDVWVRKPGFCLRETWRGRVTALRGLLMGRSVKGGSHRFGESLGF